MQFKILSVLALGAVVIADEHTHNTLKQIRAATNSFHEKMAGWDGRYLGAVPVVKQAHNLKRTLNNALAPASLDESIIARRSDELEAETMEMARNMADEIGEAVDTAIGMMPLLEGIPYAGKKVGKMIFNNLHGATRNLGEEFAPRASEEHRETAQDIVRRIDEHLMRGMAAFQ